jgi:hypothetical protein
MINIVFPLVFLLGLTQARRAFRAARMLVVFMIPFSWLVFVVMGIFPREEYFLWVGGMLLALFSEEIAMSRSGRSSLS